MSENTATLSDIQKLIEREKEIEAAIRLLDNLFGKNPWHEHQQTLFFLKGYASCLKWVSMLKDL